MDTTLVPTESQADSVDKLQKAIRNQQVIQFKTTAGWRTVEPHRIGYVKGEPTLLLVYGYSRDIAVNQDTPTRWQVFRLGDMHQLSLTMYIFDTHHDYQDPTHLPDSLAGPLVWLSQGISPSTRVSR